jgi:hypothetical protein
MPPPGMGMGMGMPPPGMGMGMGMPPAGMAVGMAGPIRYPSFAGQLAANMFYKPIWTHKREHKLQKIYYKITKDGVITHKEILKVLKEFHYELSLGEAQMFFSVLDRNRDGHISLEEFRLALQEFVVAYPRMMNPKKARKAHHAHGYAWHTHSSFPRQFGHLYQHHHHVHF